MNNYYFVCCAVCAVLLLYLFAPAYSYAQETESIELQKKAPIVASLIIKYSGIKGEADFFEQSLKNEMSKVFERVIIDNKNADLIVKVDLQEVYYTNMGMRSARIVLTFKVDVYIYDNTLLFSKKIIIYKLLGASYLRGRLKEERSVSKNYITYLEDVKLDWETGEGVNKPLYPKFVPIFKERDLHYISLAFKAACLRIARAIPNDLMRDRKIISYLGLDVDEANMEDEQLYKDYHLFISPGLWYAFWKVLDSKETDGVSRDMSPAFVNSWALGGNYQNLSLLGIFALNVLEIKQGIDSFFYDTSGLISWKIMEDSYLWVKVYKGRYKGRTNYSPPLDEENHPTGEIRNFPSHTDLLMTELNYGIKLSPHYNYLMAFNLLYIHYNRPLIIDGGAIPAMMRMYLFSIKGLSDNELGIYPISKGASFYGNSSFGIGPTKTTVYKKVKWSTGVLFNFSGGLLYESIVMNNHFNIRLGYRLDIIFSDWGADIIHGPNTSFTWAY